MFCLNHQDIQTGAPSGGRTEERIIPPSSSPGGNAVCDVSGTPHCGRTFRPCQSAAAICDTGVPRDIRPPDTIFILRQAPLHKAAQRGEPFLRRHACGDVFPCPAPAVPRAAPRAVCAMPLYAAQRTPARCAGTRAHTVERDTPSAPRHRRKAHPRKHTLPPQPGSFRSARWHEVKAVQHSHPVGHGYRRRAEHATTACLWLLGWALAPLLRRFRRDSDSLLFAPFAGCPVKTWYFS